MTTIDLTNPTVVACAWSAVIEPGDIVAHTLIDAVGADVALDWLLTCDSVDAIGGASDALNALTPAARHAFTTAWQRWKPRARDLHVERDLEFMERNGGHVIYPGHECWPDEFDTLGDEAPLCLWVFGDIIPAPRLAIVGARACTNDGGTLAWEIARECAQRGVEIVSGGAIGIDAAAHRGAVTCGRTTAFMAGGLESLYPIAHLDLFEEVRRRGALISEVPPSWRPARWRFLTRNRLIAAYAHATVVVEASPRSGALATARRALEIGRPTGAVPGNVMSTYSAGCHHIIRDGATLVTCADEVMELITTWGQSDQYPHVRNLSGGVEHAGGATQAHGSLSGEWNAVEQRVFDALPQRARCHVDRLTRESGLSRREVDSALAGLILGGVVSNEGEWLWRVG